MIDDAANEIKEGPTPKDIIIAVKQAFNTDAGKRALNHLEDYACLTRNIDTGDLYRDQRMLGRREVLVYIKRVIDYDMSRFDRIANSNGNDY